MAIALKTAAEPSVSGIHLAAANTDWDLGPAPRMPSEFDVLDPQNVVNRRLIWNAGVLAGKQWGLDSARAEKRSWVGDAPGPVYFPEPQLEAFGPVTKLFCWIGLPTLAWLALWYGWQWGAQVLDHIKFGAGA